MSSLCIYNCRTGIDSGNSYPFEEIVVSDGPGSTTTTVKVETGGKASGIDASEGSVIFVDGGYVSAPIWIRDSVELSILGGSVTELNAMPNSKLWVTGGTIQADLNFANCSWLKVSGGLFHTGLDIDNLVFGEVSGGSMAFIDASNSRLRFSGGEIQDQFVAYGTSIIDISAGDFLRNFFVKDDSKGNVYGGYFPDGLVAQNNSQLNVYGGSIDKSILAFDNSKIIVSGYSFNFPLGDLVPLSGTLIGTLSDGTTINTPFGRSSTARIVLVGESDSDSDGVSDGLDNCPQVPNTDQMDTDSNGVGDACNEAEDQDGNEFADGLDNCLSEYNPDQADRDYDSIGDLCDPFPDNPDNALAQCEADLAECFENPIFADEDSDGEADLTDLCPDTPSDTEVDSNGCSLWQFCTAIDTSSHHGRQICNRSDWKNDEPLGNKGDCEAIREGHGPSNYLCIPR